MGEEVFHELFSFLGDEVVLPDDLVDVIFFFKLGSLDKVNSISVRRKGNVCNWSVGEKDPVFDLLSGGIILEEIPIFSGTSRNH